jgi:CubicO group peptidase (beta-lactamase class C family)
MRILSTLACLLALQLCAAQSFFPQADSIRKSRGVPALGYAVFSEDKIIDMGVSGYRRYHTKDTARSTDRFSLGTNSFVFVAWVAGKLVETGKIKWTTTFASLYPEYSKKILPQYSNLDLKSLLSNTGGIQPYKQIDDYVHIPLFTGDEQLQRKEFAAWVLQKPGLNDARENKVVESVAGYTIAVSMLEKSSGLSWSKLIETYVNKPFGISVKFGWPNTISPDQPWGHWSKYGGLSAEPPDSWVKPYPSIISASGVNISLADFTRFLQNELKGLRGSKSNLSQSTLQLIHFGNPYPMGWGNGATGDTKVAIHTGDSYLFNSYVELMPDKNIGILVVCNDGDSLGKGAVIHLARLIAESIADHN